MNNKTYKYEKYMKNLPYIKDLQLYKAVGMTLYLIIDKNRTLKFALSSASTNHNFKPKKRIEDLVKIALPDDFFEKRQRANAPKEKREEAAVRHQMLKEMDSLAQLHLKGLFGQG
ncbi:MULTISPECIES: hypothetical protein [unclassified Pseudoalteromonas]|uniref:hypothetical protein n=1 Tax=unclassified Pseudoalteromonas TaxID=194690 RepID=UPI0015FFC66A|nr:MULTISPECIES: hypothetical protein [unclassified Pseudoalteromonas]MBB1294603.1 hypothetical protein [Pseudoalteromonas sp. SR41-4]MBB1507466.1 hypothetical protein [Pseudoalteromonas sp. SG41-1]